MLQLVSTAAEVIAQRSNANKDELDALNRIVTMYLDDAELQAKNHRQMFMKDWRKKLDAFLQFNDQEILKNAGSIRKKIADKLAEETYNTYHQNRLKTEAKKLGDIDEAIKKIK